MTITPTLETAVAKAVEERMDEIMEVLQRGSAVEVKIVRTPERVSAYVLKPEDYY